MTIIKHAVWTYFFKFNSKMLYKTKDTELFHFCFLLNLERLKYPSHNTDYTWTDIAWKGDGEL